MKSQNPIPPKSAESFLLWVIKRDLLEEILGDLHEYHEGLLDMPNWKRKLFYWFHVFHFLRPFAIKKSSSNNSNKIDMFKHYILTSFRQLQRQRGISFSYMLGLVLGITSSLLIFLIVMQEHSFDQHHPNVDRIYRVQTTKVGQSATYPGTPTGVVTALRNDFEAIEKAGAVLFRKAKTVTIDQENEVNRYKESVAFVENELFQILDFHLLIGNPKTELKTPNTLILSESYAQKYFGSADEALGESLQIDGQNWIVTGIVADPSANTDFPFHIMASYTTLRLADNRYDQQHGGWNDNHQTFILLQEGRSDQEIELQFPQMIEKYMGKEDLEKRAYALLPLSELHFNYNFSGRSANPQMLKALMGVGLFLLLISCANFINLATAQGIKRSKEVGIRKVIGSNRLQLVYQFICEAGLLTLFALMLSTGTAYLLLPHISQLMGLPIEPSFILSKSTSIFLLSVFVGTSLLAGFYPALILSSLNPVNAIRNAMKGKFTSGVSLRNSLVVFQFCISLILVISTLIIGKQLQLFKNAHLGFNHESVITVEIPESELSSLEVIRQELLTHPFIQNVSFSNNSPSSENNWMRIAGYTQEGEEKEINVQLKMVDSYFLDTYGIELIAGGQIRSGETASKAIINEVMVERMGLNNPQDAIGQRLSLGEENLQVAGVVKNFHVNSLHQQIDPTLVYVNPQRYYQGSIKLHQAKLTPENLNETISLIQQVWTSNFPEHVFAYQFLDQTIEDVYKKETQTSHLVNIATGMAILISCMGLLGLVSFTVKTKTKEIGVRKVLGASVQSIAKLLSLDFLKLVLIAVAIGSPLAWYLMDSWLQDFAFRTEISWWIYTLAAGGVIIITLLTVSFHAMKAGKMNPVNSLRSE